MRVPHDAAWGRFRQFLAYKTESAGKAESAALEGIAVDPRGTSQLCSECGCHVPKTLAVRSHDCPECGSSAERDVNAARNVLLRGNVLTPRGVPLRAAAWNGPRSEVCRLRRNLLQKPSAFADEVFTTDFLVSLLHQIRHRAASTLRSVQRRRTLTCGRSGGVSPAIRLARVRSARLGDDERRGKWSCRRRLRLIPPLCRRGSPSL